MKFGLTPGPYLRNKKSTTGIMLELLIGLFIIWIAAIVYYFITGFNNGLHAIINPLIAIISAVVTECLFFLPKHIKEKGKLSNLISKLIHSYGYITGLILGLMLPIATSIYAIIISTIFAIAVGKMLFGGFGYNIFNPAIVGRIFAQTAFLSQMEYDTSVSIGATVTTQMGNNGWALESLTKTNYSLVDLLIGNYRGALGETFTLLILAVGIVLMIRKVINWKMPTFYLGTIFVSTLLMGLFAGYGLDSFEFALTQLSLGGIMFGAIFCITDPVTTPTSSYGRMIFALGSAMLTMLIRFFGNAPEGVAYSILLMNALTPFIDSCVKNLSNKFTVKKIVVTSTITALSLTTGLVGGLNEVNKAAFVNISSNKTYDIASYVKKVEEINGISKYHVTVTGILNDNDAYSLGTVQEIFGDLSAFEEYLNKDNAKFVIKSNWGSYSLAISYKENKETKEFDTGLALNAMIEDGVWKFNNFKSEFKESQYNSIFGFEIVDDEVIVTFASDHTYADTWAAPTASMEYYVSLNYSKKVITSTQYIASSTSPGYGAALLQDGDNINAYSTELTDAQKALCVAFYEKYIEVNEEKPFSLYTQTRINHFSPNDYGEIVAIGCTYTAMGYLCLMQSVIDYATAEHTIGKVVLYE